MWIRRGMDSEFVETLLEAPRDTVWNKWIFGCAFPGLLALWGTWGLAVQQISLTLPSRLRWGRSIGRGWSHGPYFQTTTFIGPDAWWVAMAVLSLVFFLNTHFFWSNQEKLQPYAEGVRTVAMLGFVICVVVPVFNSIRPF